MAEEIGLSIRKLPKNTSLYPIMGQTKPGNFCLPDWKPNTMSPYSDTTSCNSSPKKHGGATSFSTLLIKNHFCSFCTCDSVPRNDGDSTKKKLYLYLLA